MSIEADSRGGCLPRFDAARVSVKAQDAASVYAIGSCRVLVAAAGCAACAAGPPVVTAPKRSRLHLSAACRRGVGTAGRDRATSRVGLAARPAIFALPSANSTPRSSSRRRSIRRKRARIRRAGAQATQGGAAALRSRAVLESAVRAGARGRGEALLGAGRARRRRCRASMPPWRRSVAHRSAHAHRRAAVPRAQQQDIAGAREAGASRRLDEATRLPAAIAGVAREPLPASRAGDVERRAGQLDGARTFRRSPSSSPTSANPREIGEILEARSEFAKAADASRPALLQPDEAPAGGSSAARRARRRGDAGGVPRDRASAGRHAGAARGAVGVRSKLARAAPPVNAVVITDIRGHWAQPWILAGARAGVMEAYPNTRSSRTRRAARRPGADRVAPVLEPRREADRSSPPPPGGRGSSPTSRPAIELSGRALAVEAGVMTAAEGGFQLTRPVTGAEAVAPSTSSRNSRGRRRPMNLTTRPTSSPSCGCC